MAVLVPQFYCSQCTPVPVPLEKIIHRERSRDGTRTGLIFPRPSFSHGNYNLVERGGLVVA